METLDDYIAFYEAIPADKWCMYEFTNGGRCCALGHLGERHMGLTTPQAYQFNEVLKKHRGDMHYIPDVNDGKNGYEEIGSTPKERVINYLKQLRDGNGK